MVTIQILLTVHMVTIQIFFNNHPDFIITRSLFSDSFIFSSTFVICTSMAHFNLFHPILYRGHSGERDPYYFIAY